MLESQMILNLIDSLSRFTNEGVEAWRKDHPSAHEALKTEAETLRKKCRAFEDDPRYTDFFQYYILYGKIMHPYPLKQYDLGVRVYYQKEQNRKDNTHWNTP